MGRYTSLNGSKIKRGEGMVGIVNIQFDNYNVQEIQRTINDLTDTFSEKGLGLLMQHPVVQVNLANIESLTDGIERVDGTTSKTYKLYAIYQNGEDESVENFKFMLEDCMTEFCGKHSRIMISIHYMNSEVANIKSSIE